MESLVYIVSFLLVILSYPKLSESQNVIDACWRRNPKWSTNRQALANCAVGFGKTAMGGRQGPVYVVTSPADDPKSPKPGTLRYGAMQKKPLWITFAKDMVIVLQMELLVSSYKTIDGRGAKVQIARGHCVRMYHVSHVIIHGITIHDCKPDVGRAGDGDAIRVTQSTHIWIDHCHLSRCQDGLIDVISGSTAVTISNNYFTQHQKAVLLGHDDSHVQDKKMRVTVAFNYFGAGINGRMPRVRHGYAHVANNRYEQWNIYAIGGSADPIIFSEGNYFVAGKVKQVTKRQNGGAAALKWKWGTSMDVFKGGAFFGPAGAIVRPPYSAGEAFKVSPGSQVPTLTASAGPLPCVVGRAC